MQLVREGQMRPVLEADDSFAAEAALAKLFEHLRRAIQFNGGIDANSDRTFRDHACHLVQPLRR